MTEHKKIWREQSWFWLLLLLFIACLFLYIGNGVISAILQHYDTAETPPAFPEELFSPSLQTNPPYLFCQVHGEFPKEKA